MFGVEISQRAALKGQRVAEMGKRVGLCQGLAGALC